MRYNNNILLKIKEIKYNIKWYLNFTVHKLIRNLFLIQRGKAVTIIPHEGLGDLVSILPALQTLHREGVHVTLVTDVAKWSQIRNAFIGVPDIDIIQMGPNSSYSVPQHILKYHRSSLIPLGFFLKFDFILDYPYSFYWQLGVDRSVMTNLLHPKPCNDDFYLPEPYDFIDLGISKGAIDSNYFSSAKNKVIFLNNTEMKVFSPESELHLVLDVGVSFHQKIVIALKSQLIVCSDAALFNAVVRMPKHPRMMVQTRRHYHSHCKEVYGECRFDGGIYEFPARHDLI
jgi:hypothetical protein